MVRLEIVLDKRTKKKNGKYPLRLRITNYKEVRFISLGVDYTINQYEIIFNGTPPTELLVHKEKANEILSNAIRLSQSLPVFDFNRFKELLKNGAGAVKNKSDFIEDLFNEMITHKKKISGVKTSIVYRTAKNNILSFRSNLRLQDITSEFLQEYEDWFLKKTDGVLTSSLSIHLRCLRTIINKQKSKNLLPTDFIYPFGRHAYQIPEVFRPKQTLTMEELNTLVNFENFDDDSQRTARDIWLFQLHCNGVNFKDLIKLKWSDRVGDFFYLRREKTKNATRSNPLMVKIPITEKMEKILEKVGDKNSPYVLGFLQEGWNEEQIYNKKSKVRRKINEQLFKIKDKLNLSVNLYTKTARDAYATCLKRKNRTIEQIAEMLGHSSTKVTKHYLDSFENDTLRHINDCLP